MIHKEFVQNLAQNLNLKRNVGNVKGLRFIGEKLNSDSENQRVNPFRVVGKQSRQCRTSSSHSGGEKSIEKHQPISEGISREPRIISSHTGPQKIAERISFHVTTNDMMVAEQV